jgi:hypothetical protein
MNNMTKDTYLQWLKWLFKKTKMFKVITWQGIINLIFRLKIKLLLWINNDIMIFKNILTIDE